MNSAWFKLLTAALMSTQIARAGVIIVNTPGGVLTNSGTTNISDPVDLSGNVWERRNVRNNGTVGITNDLPRSGNGSVWLGGTSASAALTFKADIEINFTPSLFGVAGPLTLSSLQSLSYDWYRDASSTATSNLNPALRLFIDADGDLGTATDRGYLIYERANNGGPFVLTTNQWITDAITNSTNLWLRQFTPGQTLNIYNNSLAQYIAGTYATLPGFLNINGNSVIYGLSFGIGSGWTGTYTSAIDNVSIRFAGMAENTTWNFETASDPVPEPSTFALLFVGLAALHLRRS